MWNLDRGSDRDARAVHVKRAEDFQVPSTPYWQLGIPSEELEKLPRESGVFCAGCSFDSSLRVLCSSCFVFFGSASLFVGLASLLGLRCMSAVWTSYCMAI